MVASSGEDAGMTMEQMIAMKEGLEAQIKAMSKPAKVNAGKFSSRTMARSGIEEEEPPPRRLNVGQMYRVIAKFVAVRSSPSIEAPFLRRLNNGAKVEMFEWDSSRSWRRVSVESGRWVRRDVTKLRDLVGGKSKKVSEREVYIYCILHTHYCIHGFGGILGTMMRCKSLVAHVEVVR
ncbi:unnamed protein product [Durusdinium trenchii]|uniref:Uncharacterized protein n=1 Tax=Durusdinium trenchii TaxID=1381693 RepID=A0ABP0R6T0_9DINO